MKTIVGFILNNWPFFLGVVVTALLVWGVVTCQNRGETVEQQKQEITVLKSGAKTAIFKEDSLRAENKRIDAERDTCRSEQQKAITALKAANEESERKVQAFRARVAGMTTEEKQAAVLALAKSVVNGPATLTVTVRDTVLTKPLGTINLGGKTFSYYTTDQQDLLLWALGEASILKDNETVTNTAAANLDVIREAMFRSIEAVLTKEIETRHFLGINQKKALKKLKKDIDMIFGEYSPKPTTFIPVPAERSDLETELPDKSAPRS